MHFRLRDWVLIAGLLLTAHSTLVAQTIDFEVLLDLDLNPGTGCTVTPAGGAPIDGIEARARATVDSGLLQVVALETAQCAGAAFSAPVPVSGITLPYPVATNVGVNGSDAVELAASRGALGADRAALIGLTFTGDNGAGSDELATVDGTPGSGPILFGLPVQIPTLSMLGLIILIGALLIVAALAHRRMGRVGSVMAVMLVATAAWAMTFAIDGDVSDWSGVPPIAQDPGGDSTDGSASADIVAAFAALDGDRLVFRIDVADLENQVPVANDDAFSVDEDNPLSVAAPGVLANDTDGDMDPLTATLATGPSNAQAFTFNADGSFDYTPAADFSGDDSFTYVANDGQANSAAALVTITVNPINDPPVAVDDTAVTNEDVQVDIDVLANDSDVDGNLDPASVTVTTPPASGGTSVNPTNGVITYTKSADFNGADSFVYQVCDDGTPLPAQCANATVNITVNDVNDAPTFNAGPDQTVNEDAGAQTVASWATAIDPGAPNETGQVLTFSFTGNTNPALFAAGPAVDSGTGDLTFTPAADVSGSANLTLVLSDDGGTANGGVDTSAPASFTITVNPVNDAPTFTAGADVTVLEDSGAYDQPWATGIDAGAPDEGGQVLTFNITANDNPGLFAAGPAIDAGSGNLSFTPAANASGVANLSVELMDNGGTANGGVDTSASVALVITVTAINDAPSFVAGPDQTVDEDSGAQTVNGWAISIDPGAPNEAGQVLTFNITGNTDPALFSAGPSVDATTGNLSFTPAANQYGSATITLTLSDDGGTANGGIDTSTPQSFTITVNPINDPPTASSPLSFNATTHVRIDVPA
ncbi:MAG: tandem-95 repeat protein, partial [Wenzhouxiangellaceae bacterium]